MPEVRQERATTDAMLAIINASEPPKDARKEVFDWMKCQAAHVLANQYSVGLNDAVSAAMAHLIGDDLGAGAIIGSGTISNYDRTKGSSCIAEKRMLETIADGKPATPFMSFGDTVRIEMMDSDGNSIFGAIDQKVVNA